MAALASKTWNGVSGDWNIAGDWTPAGVPGSLDTAIFGGTAKYIVGIGSVTGNYTVPETETVAGITLDDAAAGLTINPGGTLYVDGILNLEAGTLGVIGVLSGGTLDIDGGVFLGEAGTLNGVSLLGPTIFPTNISGDQLYIQNGLSLIGANGTGPGSLTLAGEFDRLHFIGTQTLSNAQVTLSGLSDTVSLQTLTLAANTVLTVTGYNTAIYGGEFPAGSSLTNAGTIIVAGTTGALEINTANFTNDGLITVGSGDILSFGNQVTAPVGGTGSIAFAPGSTLVLGGTVTTAELMAEIGSLVGNQTGVIVEIGGEIDNTGATLDFSTGPLAGAVLVGDITGGTVKTGTTPLLTPSGFLDGVTLSGTIELAGSRDVLGIIDGLTAGIGGATIDLTGTDDTVLLTNTTTLDNLTFNVSGASEGVGFADDSVGVMLTLGTNFVANVSGVAYFGSDTIVSQGTINVLGPDGVFNFDTNTLFNLGTTFVGVTTAVADNASEAADSTASDSSVPSASTDTGPASPANGGATATAGGQGPINTDDQTSVAALAPRFNSNLKNTAKSNEVSVNSTRFDANGRTVQGSVTSPNPNDQGSGQTNAVADSAAEQDTSAATPPENVVFAPGSALGFGSDEATGGLPALLAGFLTLPSLIFFYGTVENANATLDITPTGTLSDIVLEGTVTDGTILNDGSLAFAAQTTLDNLAVVGSLDLSTYADAEVVLSNVTVASTTGAPAFIGINGIDDVLVYVGQTVAQALTDSTIDLGMYKGATGDRLGLVGGTMSLGVDVTISAAGTSTIFAYDNTGADAITGNTMLTNAGVINDSGLLTIVSYGGSSYTGVSELASFVNTGLIAVTPGTGAAGLTLNGTFANAGTISVTGAETLQVLGTAFDNAGVILLGGGGGISLASNQDVAGTIDLLDGAESVLVKGRGLFTATLPDFSAGDTVDFSALPPTGTLAPGFTFTGDTLEIFQGTTEVAALTLPTHAYTQNDFVLVSDKHGGTVLTTDVPCFRTGTRLRGTGGEVAVEALAVGTELLTASGAHRRVAWIGRRHVPCHRHPQPELVWPVRVTPGAFAPQKPVRDLWLSPDHAVFVDDVLIPIKHLINGRSIAQIPVDTVEYWHVELDRHDILLAEGLPAESYLDTGNRSAFAGGGAVAQLHPDFAARAWAQACAELVQDGPRLVGVKQRIFERAGPEAVPYLALRVLADRKPLAPKIDQPGRWTYRIPAGTSTLRLASPAWMPAGQEAASLDRRRLGVRLFAVMIDGVAIPLGSPALGCGFHPVETTAEGPCRWTHGEATLNVAGARTVTLLVGDHAVIAPAPICASTAGK